MNSEIDDVNDYSYCSEGNDNIDESEELNNDELGKLQIKLNFIHSKISSVEKMLKQAKFINNELHKKKERLNNKYSKLAKEKFESIEKLEYLGKWEMGEKYILPGFGEMTKHYLITHIPISPLQGINELIDNFRELRDALSENVIYGEVNDANDTIKKTVHIRYLGDTIRFLIPFNNNCFTFETLLIEACAFFDLNSDNFIMKDEGNSIWPLKSTIIDYFKLNETFDSMNLFLINRINLLSDSKKNLKEFEFIPDSLAYVVEQIKVIIMNKNQSQNTESRMLINRDSKEIAYKTNKLKIKNSNEIEMQLKIEKTFGNIFMRLMYYLAFVILILVLYGSRNKQYELWNLNELIKTELMDSKYMYNFTLSERQNVTMIVENSLRESNNLKSVSELLKAKFTSSFGLNSNGLEKFSFQSKFKIFGKLRIFQIRDKNFMNKNCEEDLQNQILFDCNITLKNFNKSLSAENSYFQSLLNEDMSSQIDEDFKEELFNGFNLRKTNQSYIYHGDLSQYKIDEGYFIDFPLRHNNESIFNIEKFFDFLNRYWISINTELIVISLNLYEPNHDDSIIISINLFIEHSKSNKLSKQFIIRRYGLFINPILPESEDTTKPNINAINKIFQIYCLEVVYLICLLVFSFTHGYKDIELIYSIGKTFIYSNEFRAWIFEVIIDIYILTQVILRLVFLAYQIKFVNNFKKDGFINYFPVLYITENYTNSIELTEVIMIMLIVQNLLNIFYSEFFGLIFITFMKSLRYIFSYFIIWILIQFAYASSCFLIYGSYIEIFSSLYSSFGTMMLFIYIPFNTIEIMKIYYPMTTNLIFFSYIPIMYFVILNTMFTILYDSYITIQQKHPFNLLNFKVLRRGIIDYGYNIYSKLKKFGTRIIKLKS